TLFLLVSACFGEGWKGMCNEDLDNNYPFLSYGDSSILSVVE
ncbi:MAG: S-adenosylmethionine:tRNA-ribosyltransferase-isomerase (queuine synthetase), partial [Bacteroidia bacterium]